jgi:uncharacterized membrane protein
MEAFKEFFRLDIILRQCLGGMAFYLALYMTENSWPKFDPNIFNHLQKLTWAQITVAVIAVFVTGTLIHALQRSTIGVVVEIVREKLFDNYPHVVGYFFPNGAQETTISRLERLAPDKMCAELYTWGASVHSLYTVAMAIILAETYNLIRGLPWGALLLLVVPLLILCGFISDCRKHILEQRLEARKSSRDWGLYP